MEDKKNYPPLPSNYLTLAQLQERWLKEKEIEQKQKLPQQNDDPVLHHPHLPQDQQRQPKTQQQAWRVIPRHGTGFGSATGNLQPKKIRPKNRNFSKSDRVAIEVRCEKQENLEAKDDIGDENAGHDDKRKESKKKKKKKRIPRKPRVDGEDRRVAEDAAESTMDRDKEAVHSDFHRVDGITESKSELNVKSTNLVMELKKQKRVSRKPRADREESRVSQDAAEWTVEGNNEVENSDVQRVDDKTESKSELNVKSKNLMKEVGGKLGTLSMKYGSEKQNVRLRRPYNSFHGAQRNYVGRPCNNGPYGDNGRFRSQQVERPRGYNKIWVRKNENFDGNVGGIEIASDTSKGRGEHT